MKKLFLGFNFRDFWINFVYLGEGGWGFLCILKKKKKILFSVEEELKKGLSPPFPPKGKNIPCRGARFWGHFNTFPGVKGKEQKNKKKNFGPPPRFLLGEKVMFQGKGKAFSLVNFPYSKVFSASGGGEKKREKAKGAYYSLSRVWPPPRKTLPLPGIKKKKNLGLNSDFLYVGDSYWGGSGILTRSFINLGGCFWEVKTQFYLLTFSKTFFHMGVFAYKSLCTKKKFFFFQNFRFMYFYRERRALFLRHPGRGEILSRGFFKGETL